jgi:Fibronectin type III domain
MASFDIAGHKVPRWAAFAGVGAVVVGGVLYFKNRNSSSSSSSTGTAANSSATDPVTGLPYSEDDQIDPATGLTYLSEAEQYGSVAAAEAAVGAGYGGVSDTGEGYSGEAYGEPTYTTAEGSSETYATNAEWAAAVQAGLPSITGDSSSDVATAVANYLAGLPLTTTQANDIQVALAEFGPPPTGSYSIIAASSSSGATSTGSASSPGSGASTSSSPTSSAPAAGAPITVAPTGFRVVSVTNGDDVNLAWNALKPPAGEGPLTGYMIAYGPTSGSQQYKQQVGGQTTEATVPGVGAGSAGKHYFELWALPAKSGGPHAGPIEATTTKS